MSPINSAVRCWEQLCEPSFFRRVAAMSGYSSGTPRSQFGTYKRHDDGERRHVADLLAEGHSSLSAARQTGIPLGTVSKWRQTLVQAGKLQPMRITT
jgi:hypothetical protein